MTISVSETLLSPRAALSVVIDVSLTSLNQSALQPDSSIEICFGVSTDVSLRESCLGYLNEEKEPPQWECEDRCLKQRENFICGKTDHLTNFAILLTGSGNAAHCDDDEIYIFSEAWQDLLFIALFIVALWIILCCCCFYLASSGKGERIVYGKEGSKAKNLRSRVSSTVVLEK